jgi:TP901 family phage tail tape measure protein
MAVGTGRIFAINLLANSKPAEDAFKKVGKAAGRLPGPVGIATAAIAASFVAVIAVVGKVTKELFDLGDAFNDSFRTIRVGTGATGEAFAALQDSFRNVAKAVPNDMGDIATAIAEVNTRTGATGVELETLAKQFLTVSRLLGGDVQANVRSVTRLFGDFGVEAKDQGDIMNILFRASQMTGASFETLADQTVQYGASLRNLGFSLPEAIALLASFEKNGTNLETVMSGLRTAQALLAESGKPLSEALADVIRDIQNAATSTEGFSLAIDTFGRKAGPDLFDAIKSGRFGVDELVEAIANGADTIEIATGETDGFRQAWEGFKNYLKITLEPAATEVFRNLTGIVEELRPATDRVVKAFEEDGLQGALAQVAEEWDRIYKDKLQPLFIKLLAFLQETVKPIALQIGEEIGGAIASGIFSAFKSGVSNLFGSKMGERILGGDLSGFELAPAPGLDLSGLVPNFPSMGGQSDFGSVRGGASQAAAIRKLKLSDFDNFKIPGLAAGGLVTSPTLAMVGEAGPELVIPLDRMGGMGGDTYVINVSGAIDPEGTARTILRTLRDAERRTGERLAV